MGNFVFVHKFVWKLASNGCFDLEPWIHCSSDDSLKIVKPIGYFILRATRKGRFACVCGIQLGYFLDRAIEQGKKRTVSNRKS